MPESVGGKRVWGGSWKGPAHLVFTSRKFPSGREHLQRPRQKLSSQQTNDRLLTFEERTQRLSTAAKIFKLNIPLTLKLFLSRAAPIPAYKLLNLGLSSLQWSLVISVLPNHMWNFIKHHVLQHFFVLMKNHHQTIHCAVDPGLNGILN